MRFPPYIPPLSHLHPSKNASLSIHESQRRFADKYSMIVIQIAHLSILFL
jgi:hypothetical protein